MSKTYPRAETEVREAHTFGKPFRGGVPCQLCKKLMVKNEKVHIITIQVSYMRGDDRIEYFCSDCLEDKDMTP